VDQFVTNFKGKILVSQQYRMSGEEFPYFKNACSEVNKLQESTFYHTEEKLKALFMLHVLSMHECAHVPSGMRDYGGHLAVFLRMAWVLPIFFMDSSEHILTHFNTPNIFCFCHPQLFLFSEQLLTSCCDLCNVVQFSASAYHECLVKHTA
jgi:hypothetical protein